MSNETEFDLKLIFDGSQAKKGIADTSKQLKDLGLHGKNVGDVIGGSFGRGFDHLSKMTKGAAGLGASFGPIGVAAVGVGLAIAGASVVASKFFSEALGRSPQLAASFEQLKERVAAIVGWIADRLTPVFQFFVDLALKLLPEVANAFALTKAQIQHNVKAMEDYQSASINALEAIAIHRAVKNKDEMAELKARQKAESDALDLKIKREEEANSKIQGKVLNIFDTSAKQKEALEAKQATETLKLQRKLADDLAKERKTERDFLNEEYKRDQARAVELAEFYAEQKKKTANMSADSRRAEAELTVNEFKRRREIIAIEQERELADENLNEEQRTLIIEKHAHRRTQIGRDEIAFGKMQTQQTIQNALTLGNALAGIIVSGNKVTRNERIAYKTMAMSTAAINTALAISGALGTPPYGPWNIANAAMLGGLGIAQQVQISQQKFERGGIIGGRRHSQGGTMIEAEAGESILTREATRRIGAEGVSNLNNGGSVGGSISIRGGDIIINGNADQDMVSRALENANDDLLRALKKAERKATRKRVTA